MRCRPFGAGSRYSRKRRSRQFRQERRFTFGGRDSRRIWKPLLIASAPRPARTAGNVPGMRNGQERTNRMARLPEPEPQQKARRSVVALDECRSTGRKP